MVLSVIIPTYNRPNALVKCLQALCDQTFNGAWEVIVVDDGGEERLDSMIMEVAREIEISLYRQENQGPATARNFGSKHATGEFLAFLDDDCMPTSSWLQELFNHSEEGLMVGGLTVNKLKNNPYSEASQVLVSYLYQYFEGTPWYFFTSNNFLVQKRDFLEIGGFDESFSTSAGEDREFCFRWLRTGGKMKYVETSRINHLHDLTFQAFWKQHLKYGRAARYFFQKTKAAKFQPQRTEIRFYIQLYAFILKLEKPEIFFQVKTICLITLSQIATFFGYLIGKGVLNKKDKREI